MKLLYTQNHVAVGRVLEIVREGLRDPISYIASASYDLVRGGCNIVRKSGLQERKEDDATVISLLLAWYPGWALGKGTPLAQTLEKNFDRLAAVYWVASQQTWKDLAEDFVPYIIAAVGDGGNDVTTTKRHRV